jgi:hypothetical protein
MAFSALDGETDYREGLTARTTASPAGIEITDPECFRILFDGVPTGRGEFGGDFFFVPTASGEIRGLFLDAFHLLITGPCRVEGSGKKITSVARDGRLLAGTTAHFRPDSLEADLDAAWRDRSAWLAARSYPENLEGPARRTLHHAFGLMKGQVCSPEGNIRRRWTTPDRWPHKDMWLWDSVFHAMGWRHVDPTLAMEILEAVFDGQREDGFVPLRASPYHIEPVMTQPPLLAYGVARVIEKTGDQGWMKRLYPKLCAYIEWDLAHRDTDGDGLVEWFLEELEHCRSGESGMDNSPRFDSGARLAAVDFNSFIALECETLAAFARQLGRDADNEKWSRRHRHLCQLINERLWSDEHNFYGDYDPALRQLTPIIANAGFLPLLCGAPSKEQAQWLARHASDPDMFATAVPIPTIAVRDHEHYVKDLFRGPTWMNVNWLIAEGFERYGMNDHAALIRNSTILEIERTVESHGVFFEYFDDRRNAEPPLLLRKGKCAPETSPYHQVIHDFGWTATLYTDLIFRATANGGKKPPVKA